MPRSLTSHQCDLGAELVISAKQRYLLFIGNNRKLLSYEAVIKKGIIGASLKNGARITNA